MLRCAACNSTLEYVISKLFDLFLVHDPIIVVNVFSFLVLIKPLSDLLPLQFAIWGGHSARVEVIDALVVQHRLHILKLHIPVERHVRHHNSNIFWSDKPVIVEVIPKSFEVK